MTWTYTITDLSTSQKDQVRLLIGDTVQTDHQLQDEEIAYLLTQRSSVYGAAADAADRCRQSSLAASTRRPTTPRPASRRWRRPTA
jgi:hypothetical protein